MFVENGHDQFNFIIGENKYQAPKTKNTDSNIVKLPWTPFTGHKIRKEL